MEKVKYVALVDCNSFFAECERVFRPDLDGKPIVVLSNNDGCIVARSLEAKKLGVPMGMPYFKIKDELKKSGVHVFSGNFPLYGDLSGRVFEVLRSFGLPLEEYSIDEGFMLISSSKDLDELGQEIADRVREWVGIPVSVGIAVNKTLAKCAADIAKSNHMSCYFLRPEYVSDVLNRISIGEIWGVGGGLSVKLQRTGITTANDLLCVHEEWLRQLSGIGGLRILYELRGEYIFLVTPSEHIHKGIQSTRSFGRPVVTKEEMLQAIAWHTDTAARKLRKQEGLAGYMSIFASSSRHNSQYRVIKNSTRFSTPQSDSRFLVKTAHNLLEAVWESGVAYKRCGIRLAEIYSKESIPQEDLFGKSSKETHLLMKTMDQLQKKYGERALMVAAAISPQEWRSRSQMRSPHYTTSWGDLPLASFEESNTIFI